MVMKIQLNKQEHELITNMVQKHSNSTAFKREFFITLMNDSKHSYLDVKLTLLDYKIWSFGGGKAIEAKATFKKMQRRLKNKSMAIALKDYDSEQNGVLSVRNLKQAFFTLFHLPSYDIENVLEYLDRDKDGFVAISEVENELRMA